MRRWKKLLLAVLAAVPLLLSGCMLSASAEDLYALPQLPREYESLSAQLNAIQASGAEYAPPQTGANLPPVQLADLNGDGVDEALAFFRVSGDERPLKLYIFRRAERNTYEQAAVIEGSGASIHSFLYRDMDGDGVQELIVSWSVSAEVQAMSVYSMKHLEPLRLMTTPYARYETVDLDGDGDLELVVLRGDDTESGMSLADFYDWDSGNSSLQLHSSARLSVSLAALQWMQVGSLQEGEAAVFVTGRAAGVDETSRAVMDILAYRQPELVNIALSEETGLSDQIFRFLNLQPTDINGDGATEIPRPAELLSEPEETYWKIYWHSYHIDGTDELQAATYHNLTDGWYLIIPDGWDGHYTVRQNNASSTVRATTFYSTRGWSIDQELLTIYTLTGTDRESQAAKSGRAILRRRTADTVYAIAYSEAYSGWRYAVDPADVEAGFSVIVNRWNTADS